MYGRGSIRVLEGVNELIMGPLLISVARGMGNASLWRLIKGDANGYMHMIGVDR